MVRELRHAKDWPLIAAALAAIAAQVAGAILLGTTVPYLSVASIVVPAFVGGAFAVGAIALVARRGLPRLAWAFAAVALTTAAAPLSIGISQVTPLWVAAGAIAPWVLPSAYLVMRLALRGSASGPIMHTASVLAAIVAGVSSATLVLTFDPGAWGWCSCVVNPMSLSEDESAYVAIERWLVAAHLGAVILTIVAVGVGVTLRPGRFRMAAFLVGGYGLSTLAWAASDIFELLPYQSAPLWISQIASTGLLIVLLSVLSEATRRRPSRAHVADLLLAARERRDAATLDELVARALGDPEAHVLWWDAEHATYRDRAGDEAVVAADAEVLEVEANGAPLARVVAGRALVADQSLLDSVSEALRLATENQRLTAELEQSLADVRDSRARILTTADETRRQVERDLHDGAQRLLVSTGLQLNLAESQVSDNPELTASLKKASEDLGAALAEMRRLAHGIAPAALIHSRLSAAIEELVLRSPVPATLVVDGDCEPGEAARTAIYFVVAECLTNAAKHADASVVEVHLTLADPVKIAVRDDGGGGADVVRGVGLRGLTDRLAALGGVLDVSSGRWGTTVVGSVPASAS